jgi:hypothetical protein
MPEGQYYLNPQTIFGVDFDPKLPREIFSLQKGQQSMEQHIPSYKYLQCTIIIVPGTLGDLDI